MATYFNKDQSLSSSYVESPPNIMYMNINGYSSSSSSPFQEISTNGEKQRLQGNDFSSWNWGSDQELSLSLNAPHMQMPPPYLGYSNLPIRLQEDDHLTNLMQIDHISTHGCPRSFPNSKYLKVAQQLLDEVVNVRKALKRPDSNMGFDDLPQDCSGSKRTELSAVEKHNLQEKLTKLVAMLDEVDGRYKQYYNQIQTVVSTFETIAGTGSAKPYTALAVQTISRHFRSLRDAITGEMKLTRKRLGVGEEEDVNVNGNVKGIGISRLRHVDHQLRRQQKGIQQQHAWRPQRGLPENSVSILRAWLFEHFLHPYPKDSDKMVLARETGLTRNQVSNWFINARVRLWKPMVEEMYKEEFGIAKSVEDMDMVPGNLTISEMDHDGGVFSDAIWFGNNGGAGSGVSLTLGLQNLGDNYRLPISTAAGDPRFANSHLLLHDFVA